MTSNRERKVENTQPVTSSSAVEGATKPRAEFTPGPWGANRYDEVNSAHGYLIAYCVGHSDSHNKANARLIAAAPDMLAALQRISAEVHAIKDKAYGPALRDAPAFRAADAAIKKATP